MKLTAKDAAVLRSAIDLAFDAGTSWLDILRLADKRKSPLKQKVYNAVERIWHAEFTESKPLSFYPLVLIKRRLTKGGEGHADASDVLCDKAAKVDYLVTEYHRLALIWKRTRDKLRGVMQAMETKRMHIASLAGLRRRLCHVGGDRIDHLV